MLEIERDSYPLPLGATARVRVERVEETTRAEGTEVRVVLTWAGTEHVGRVEGGPERDGREFLIAEATLQAITAAAGEPQGFTIEDVSTTRAGGVDVIVAVVTDERTTDPPLVGTAVLDRDNDRIGAARAVLDAVNRRLSGRL